MIKFLPSYVGSKSFWVKELQSFNGLDFIEPFCGSAVISANLARTAILNDTDPILFKILSNFEQLKYVDDFSSDDYFKYRKHEDWWKYIYYLQKMSFSGVFRYSKNGYNVPIKSNYIGAKINLYQDLKDAKKRMFELSPLVLNVDYTEIDIYLFKDKVVILDPPYEGSKADYNKMHIDYKFYWDFVEKVKSLCKHLILFDKIANLEKKGYTSLKTRKMVVNGSRQGDVEAMKIVK